MGCGMYQVKLLLLILYASLGKRINKIHCYYLYTIVSSGFMEDNPNGQLSKIKMMEMYNGVLSVSKASKFVEKIFIKFDRDNNGHIDFKVVFNIELT